MFKEIWYWIPIIGVLYLIYKIEVLHESHEFYKTSVWIYYQVGCCLILIFLTLLFNLK